jgi:hypothetical protein
MLNKVVGYTLLESDSPKDLASEVNRAIEKGWVPSGAPIASGVSICQAMLKFE